MKKILLSIAFVLLNVFIGFSQTADSNDDLPKYNNIKISLTSLAFKNLQLQYERSLTKRIGVVIGYSFIEVSI